MDAALILSSIETEMLMNLVTLLVEGDVDAADWQLNKLHQLGRLRDMNLLTIRNQRAKLVEAVSKEIRAEALKRANMVDDATLAAGKKLGDVLAPESDPILKYAIMTWEKKAASSFSNAFAPMLSRCDSIYTDTIYKAVAKQQLGISGRQAIAEACSDWSKMGIQAFQDSAGRQWTTEAYAQMIVRTNQTQAATETQFTRMEELGEDLVEISSHLGARPKCEPYQGKIYSLSGSSKNYPWLHDPANTPWGDTIGQPDGLFGINCRHVPYPYFPGTEKTFKPQDKERNDTTYANSQKQRAIERAIRADKRNLEIMMKTGDEASIAKAKASLRGSNEAMRAFLDSTGRKRRPDREEVYS